MRVMQRLLGASIRPPTISPVGAGSRPASLSFPDARSYRRLFTGLVMKRSPGRVNRGGGWKDFLYHSAMLKMEADVARGYDVSTVLYPYGFELQAWGVVVDPVGRVFEVSSGPGELVELEYQGGCFRSEQEWRHRVGMRDRDAEHEVRRFYNRMRLDARNRIIVAGTVGFGLWDALWMSFDLNRAKELVAYHTDFVRAVFAFWGKFHLDVAGAMLDAGIRIVFLRENPLGFPSGGGLAALIDPLARDHYRELCRIVQGRGGCVILDCDADDTIETDFPRRWGFGGIGPLLFRDEDELLTARRALDDDLLLVAAVAFPDVRKRLDDNPRLASGVMLTAKLGHWFGVARQDEAANPFLPRAGAG